MPIVLSGATSGSATLQSTDATTTTITLPGTTGTLALAPSGGKYGLGITGEVWYDLTASRTAGTTYTNSNSYPIMVAVGLRASSAGPTQTSLYVNGVTVANAQFGGWTGTGCWPASTIVPPGATYSVTAGYTLYYWAELY
jgi:hypothetical protein